MFNADNIKFCCVLFSGLVSFNFMSPVSVLTCKNILLEGFKLLFLYLESFVAYILGCVLFL